MTKGRYEIAYRMLSKLITYVRKEFQHKDSMIFFHLCRALDLMESVYKISEEEKEKILK